MATFSYTHLPAYTFTPRLISLDLRQAFSSPISAIIRPYGNVALVNALVEARNEKSLLRLQSKLARVSLLVIDELGYLPFSKTGAELLFEIFSQRYERGSILVTTNLPFEEWTGMFQSERLTGGLQTERLPAELPRDRPRRGGLVLAPGPGGDEACRV